MDQSIAVPRCLTSMVKILLTASVLWSGLLIRASDAADRVWRLKNGNQVEATFLRLKKGRVYLKRTDGRTINIGLNKLSMADREFVAKNVAPTKKETSPKKEDSPRNAASPKSKINDDQVSTSLEKDAWYATKRFIRAEGLLAEFLLKAGQRLDFDVTANGKPNLYVGFRAKEQEAIGKSFGDQSQGAIELVSLDAPNDPLSSNLGGGSQWPVKSGKLRFSIENHSKVDTRVVIHTRKSENQGVKFAKVERAAAKAKISDLRAIYDTKSDEIYAAFDARAKSGGLLVQASNMKIRAFTELTRQYTIALERRLKESPELAKEISAEKRRVMGILGDVKAFRDLKKSKRDRKK